MIVCTACGTRNEDGESFCGECGSYLEWEGERVGPPSEPEPAPPPAVEVAGAGFVERVKTAVGIGETARPEGGQDSSDAPAGSIPPDPAQHNCPAEQAPPPQEPAAPAAVRPGAAAPKPRRRELPPEDRPPAPGETICGSCGAGNAPTRKFCRRCGTDLADAPVARRPPWWRRIFRRRRDGAPAAGTRPQHKARRSHRGLLTAAVIVVVLVVAGALTRPLWSSAYNQVRDRIQGTKIVNPTAFRASTAARGHGAAKVRDGAPNLYWAPDPKAKAVGQYVQLGFSSPYRLVYLRVFNGASDQLNDYLAEASAERIEVTLTRDGGETVTKHFTLHDKPGSQDLHVAVDDVTGVRVTVESAYRAQPGRLVALGELEFLARK